MVKLHTALAKATWHTRNLCHMANQKLWMLLDRDMFSGSYNTSSQLRVSEALTGHISATCQRLTRRFSLVPKYFILLHNPYVNCVPEYIDITHCLHDPTSYHITLLRSYAGKISSMLYGWKKSRSISKPWSTLHFSRAMY